MATFGKTDIGGSTYWGTAGDVKYACKFTLSEDGDISKITLYCRAHEGTSNVRCGIYSDDAGSPDALEGTSAEVSVSTSWAWRDFAFSPSISLLAGTYWLACIFSVRLYIVYDAGASNQWVDKADTYSDGFSDPFGTPAHWYAYEMSIYATYTPSGILIEVTDSLSLSEAISCNKTLAVSDSLSLSEAVLRNKPLVEVLDSLGLSEAVLTDKTLAVTDVLSLAELVSVDTGYTLQEVLDTLTLSDIVSVAKELYISDTLTLQELVKRIGEILLDKTKLDKTKLDKAKRDK